MPILPTKTSLISIDLILEKGEVNEGDSVADLGCGRSIFFLYSLASLVGITGKVYGIDILPEALDSVSHDVTHHRLSMIKVIRANLEKPHGVSLSDDSISSAFLINTLSQSTDSLAMLREAKRLLKPGGRLIVVDWTTADSPFGPDQTRRISAAHVNDLIELCELKTLDHFDAGPYHYGIVITK